MLCLAIDNHEFLFFTVFICASVLQLFTLSWLCAALFLLVANWLPVSGPSANLALRLFIHKSTSLNSGKFFCLLLSDLRIPLSYLIYFWPLLLSQYLAGPSPMLIPVWQHLHQHMCGFCGQQDLSLRPQT